MAAPTKITPANYSTLLVRSDNPRGSAPNGNIYLDLDNDIVQLITIEELATVDLGSGLEANPFTNNTGIQGLAAYFWLLDLIATDATVQGYSAQMDAVPFRMGKLVGAMAMINGIKWDATGGSLSEERNKIVDTGLTEYAAGGGGNTLIDRVLHGVKPTGTISATCQCYYQLTDSLSEADRLASPPVDFSRVGEFNDMIQTFGTTTNGDTGAGDFDNLTSKVLILRAVELGQTVSEVTNIDAGVDELGAYSQGYGLSQSGVQELSGYNAADVYGGSEVAPFDGMTFARNAAPVTLSGFVEGNGDFTDIMPANGGTLLDVRARLDMFMSSDDDINANTGATGPFRAKRAEPLYTITANGLLKTRQGFAITGLPAGNLLEIIQTADNGTTRTYPVPDPQIDVRISDAWIADTEGHWFRGLFKDGAGGLDFETANAVTVEDSSSVALAGDDTDVRLVNTGAGGWVLRFLFNWAANTQAGLPASTDKEIVFQLGSKNTKIKTIEFSITSAASQIYDARNDAETNSA